jgi:cytoskeletal protein RodZ
MQTWHNTILRMAVYGAVIPGILGVLSHAQQAPNSPIDSSAHTEKPAEKQVRQDLGPNQSLGTAQLPDSPGAVYEKLQLSEGKVTSEKTSGNSSQTISPRIIQAQTIALAAPQGEPAQSSVAQDPGQSPVGTAAAGPVPASGVAAAQPTGVAIAPGKQHRVRTIVLRVGAIIGAGVAVGSVVALTEATPSRPPGAH